MSVVCDCAAGALGGIAGLLIGHPLDTVKVTLQVTNRGKQGRILNCLKDVAANGLKNGFYRGLALPLSSATLQSSIFFGSYGFAMSHLCPELNHGETNLRDREVNFRNRIPSYWQVYLAGFAGGLFQTLFFCPSDRIKVVLQSQIGNSVTSQKYHSELNVRYFYGPKEAVTWLCRNHGLRKTFYRGYTALMLRDSNSFGIYVVTYEVVKDVVISQLGFKKRDEIISSLVAGGLAGSTSWFCAMPFDVIKNVFQSDVTHSKYRNIWHCAVLLYAQHGYKIFFRGSTVICLQALPVNGVIFLTYSETLKLFQNWHASRYS